MTVNRTLVGDPSTSHLYRQSSKMAHSLHMFSRLLTIQTVFSMALCSLFANKITIDIVEEMITTYPRYALDMGCPIKMCRKPRVVIPDIEILLAEGLINISLINMSYQCDRILSSCFCDNLCLLRGDCCPDAEHFQLGSLPNRTLLNETIVINMNESTYFSTRKTVSYIKSCHPAYDDNIIVDKCLIEGNTVETMILVQKRLTQEVYRNVYCAKCNFLDEAMIQPWTMQTECVQSARFRVLGNCPLVPEIKSGGCRVTFEPVPTFHRSKSTGPFIKDCNVTGRWPEYVSFMHFGCSAFSAIFCERYQNVFCFACNTHPLDLISGFMECMQLITNTNERTLPPSFSVLVDVDRWQKPMIPTRTCAWDMVYDTYKKTCRQLSCPTPLILRGHKCVPAIPTCLSSFIQLTADEWPEELVTNLTFAEDFRSHIRTVMQAEQYTMFKIHPINANKSRYLKMFVVHAIFPYDFKLLDNFRIYDHDYITIQLPNQDEFQVFVKILSDPISAVITIDLVNDMVFKKDSLIMAANLTSSILADETNIGDCCYSEILQPFYLMCTQVSLNIREYSVNISEEGMYVEELNRLFGSHAFEITWDDQFRICLDDFVKPISERAKEGIFSLFTSYITLICSIVSIVCLIAVIVTYATFKVLRTQPGINNIFVSSFYLIGQVLFLCGIRKTDSFIVCKLLGIGLHFSWLSAFFWSTVCTFHMFRVFHKNALPKDFRTGKTTLLYFSFAFVCALFFVAINIAVSLFNSNNNDIGYGGSGLCWISQPVMVGVTVVCPAMLTVVINSALFILVMRIFRNIPKVHRSNVDGIKSDRSFLIIYIKLSSITCITWLSAIPYLITGSEFFEVTFITLTVNQGLFIMVSFLVNRRVFSLYKDIFATKKEKQRTSPMFIRSLSNT